MPHAVDFSSESGRVSFSILQGHGFSDPFLMGPSGPTAHVAPLYPYLVAGIGAIFGTGAAGWAAIVTITAMAWAFQWAYAWRFAAAYGQATPGLIAGLIGVLIPLQGRLFKWEAVFVGAALAYSAWAMSQILRGTLKAAPLRLGVGMGLAVLACPSAILIWPAWAALCLWRLGSARAMRIVIGSLILIVVPVSVWTARNWATFGRLFFIRDNLGLELNIAYNDCSWPLLSQNIASGCFAKQHPSGNAALLRAVQATGEIEFSRGSMRKAETWIADHPAKSLTLTLAHVAYFWFPLEKSDNRVLAYGIVMSLVTLMSLAGLFWKSDGRIILILTMVPFSAIYCFTQFEQRYRFPVLWASAILAAVGMRLAAGWMLRKRAGYRRV
jgi:hypothetical protein